MSNTQFNNVRASGKRDGREQTSSQNPLEGKKQKAPRDKLGKSKAGQKSATNFKQRFDIDVEVLHLLTQGYGKFPSQKVDFLKSLILQAENQISLIQGSSVKAQVFDKTSPEEQKDREIPELGKMPSPRPVVHSKNEQISLMSDILRSLLSLISGEVKEKTLQLITFTTLEGNTSHKKFFLFYEIIEIFKLDQILFFNFKPDGTGYDVEDIQDVCRAQKIYISRDKKNLINAKLQSLSGVILQQNLYRSISCEIEQVFDKQIAEQWIKFIALLAQGRLVELREALAKRLRDAKELELLSAFRQNKSARLSANLQSDTQITQKSGLPKPGLKKPKNQMLNNILHSVVLAQGVAQVTQQLDNVSQEKNVPDQAVSQNSERPEVQDSNEHSYGLEFSDPKQGSVSTSKK